MLNKDLLKVLVFQQSALETFIQQDDRQKAVRLLEEAKDTLRKITKDVDLTEGNSLNDNILWFGEDIGKEVTELLEYFSKE